MSDTMHVGPDPADVPLPLPDLPDPLPEERPLFPPHMSPSSINSLLTCGEQFRLQKVVRVPSRPMWGGVGGSVVHKLTEERDREWYEKRIGQ